MGKIVKSLSNLTNREILTSSDKLDIWRLRENALEGIVPLPGAIVQGQRSFNKSQSTEKLCLFKERQFIGWGGPEHSLECRG